MPAPQTRGARRNQARQRARESLRIVKQKELEARRSDPETRRLVRQRVSASFFDQLFRQARAILGQDGRELRTSSISSI